MNTREIVFFCKMIYKIHLYYVIFITNKKGGNEYENYIYKKICCKKN